MAEHEVSVRELRQNLSVHLRRVQAGETLAVLSRGEPVAVLAPIGGGSRLARLTAEGRVSAPEEPWRDPRPVPLEGGDDAPLTDALLALRDEDER